MKSYEMIQANGEKATISSSAEARQVMAGFEPFADRFLADIDSVTSVDAASFAFLQRIADRWDTNCNVLKALEADGELMLAEKKAADIKLAQAIKEMARQCRDE